MTEEQKSVYVVLSRSGTVLSRIIHVITHDRFTHSAIALDVEMEEMFSFGRRYDRNPFLGCFKREHLTDLHYRRGSPGAIIELPVTQEQYDEISRHIMVFRRNSDAFTYNVPGLITSIFHRTFEGTRRFFCSEFVYFVLNEAGVCDFGMTRGHVRPAMFLEANGSVVYEGELPLYMPRRELATPRTSAMGV